MNKIVPMAGLLLLANFSHSAFADFDNDYASQLVKKFSEIVACQLQPVSEDHPLQYKSVQIAKGIHSPDGFGATYVVHWVGDYGCYGGNGASLPQFTIVTRSGFGSADPVVKADRKLPNDVALNVVTDFYAGDSEGVFHIEGLGYGSGDRQGNPQAHKHYKVEFNFGEYVEISDLSEDS